MTTTTDRQRANMLKVIRTAVRLKYSLMADDELAVVLPEAQKKFDAAVHRGVLPEPIDIRRALKL